MDGSQKVSTTTVVGIPPKWAQAANIGDHGLWPPDLNRLFVTLGTNDFDKRLMAFANKRNIYVGGLDWRDEVLRQAAIDHPELREPKKRGAPKKRASTGNSLLDLIVGANRDDAAIKVIEYLDELNAERAAAGNKPLSDRAFLKMWLNHRGYQEGDASGLFASKLQVQANRISKARKATGRERRDTK